MIKTIYISWRKNSGSRRRIFAKLQKNFNGILFSYTKDYEEVKKEGIKNFMGIKDNTQFSFAEADKLLSLRVISKDRPDKKEFLEFFEAQNTDNIFDLIGLTQGKSPTDNIEFLADFLTVKGDNLKFVTDLAGLSILKLTPGTVNVGETLTYIKEPENKYDNNAVAVFKGETKVGYIKQIHNRIFNLRRPLKITVKALDEHEFINQIFVIIEK